jgi:hypothetical protein
MCADLAQSLIGNSRSAVTGVRPQKEENLALRPGTVGDLSFTSDGVPTVSYLRFIYFRSDLQYSIVIP